MCLTLIFMSGCSKHKTNIKGWDLIWSDEFDGKNINYSNWGFDLGTGAPVFEDFSPSSSIFVPKEFPKDNFSVRWHGLLTPDHKCNYEIFLIADDGIRLFLNEKSIINGWKNQPATEYSAKQYLDQKDYKIVIEYFEEGGGEAAILGWECKHNPKMLINENHLSSNGSVGLSGTYFSNKNFKKSTDTFTRIDKEINWVTGGSGWGNKELQYYTKEKDNVRLERGHLIIEAKNEYYKGSDFTSARIKTKKSWKYGKFIMRAKLPKGVGTWAAFWGLPTDWKYGGWPYSGEIDVLEHVGHNEGHIVSSVHNIAKSGDLYKSDQQNNLFLKDACDTFNDYKLEWNEEKITTYINNKKIFEYQKNDKKWQHWPFDEKFHFLFNIAVGGNWGGEKGVEKSDFPTKMEIDYFRVYKKAI